MMEPRTHMPHLKMQSLTEVNLEGNFLLCQDPGTF